ncbi:MAG: hypothetical protein K0S40_1256 [Actinomycetospora sp.]|nr:hypothetical protein [Actinomycetospora sp.]
MSVRVLLGVLAASQIITGGWALLAPPSFYADFPYGGTPWVALLPPYNEHLVRDVGAGTLALAVALALAAWWLDRRVVITAVAAFLTFTVPHAVFHSLHLEHFPLADAVAQQAGFVAEIVLAVAVLVLVTRDRVPVPR